MIEVLQKKTIDALPAGILMGALIILWLATNRWQMPRDFACYAIGCGVGFGLAVISMTAVETPIAERTGRALEAWRPSLKRTMGKAIAQEMQRMLREDAEVQARIRTQVMHLIDAQKSLA